MPIAVRRYGPVLGAGTTLTEKLAQKQIIPSPLGVVAWAGICEKGPTDELIEINGRLDYERKCGNTLPESDLPDNAFDFWDASGGVGKMYLKRVTDGTDRQAEFTFKTRETTGKGIGYWRNICKVTAKSGGRWAGAFNRRIGEITGSGDLTETTIDTGLTLLEDEFADGTLLMDELPGVVFQIVGNTTAGVVTVKSDSMLATQFGSGTDNGFVLFKSNVDELGRTKTLEIFWKDGARDPDNEFGLEVYWNGTKVLSYDNLSPDQNSDVYFVRVINDDTSNHEIEVEDLFVGTINDWVKPANQAGIIPTAGLTATTLTLEWNQIAYDSGNTGTGVLTMAAALTSTQRDFITLECTNATTPGSEVWSVTSTEQDVTFADATTAVAYTSPNDYFVEFTVGVGAPGWAVGDKIYITVEPVKAAEAVGGRLYYDTDSAPRNYLTIVSATVSTVSVSPGNDLTALSAVGNPYRIDYREGLEKGYDGHAGIVDNDYIEAWNQTTSLFNNLKNRQLGLVKYATPGITTTTVQTAARAYAEANNGPYRNELPSSVTDETSAIDYMDDTLGRNDFAQVIYPSYYYKNNPDANGLKLVSATGHVQGVESRFAYQWSGYHKAAAGTDARLFKVVKLPTGDHVIDDELTNPKGIQVIIKKEGNWVIWGDRVPATSTGLTFKHHREMLSHYERVLFENYDWIIFQINDTDLWPVLLASFKAYFLPEWRPKRALRGDTFEQAAQFKVDSENNTNATMATGDTNAEIKLRLADTVERLNIIISPAGIFEELGVA